MGHGMPRLRPERLGRPLQWRERMWVPKRDRPVALKLHVVEAIRRSEDFDHEDLYGKILREVVNVPRASAALEHIAPMVAKVVSGEERGLDFSAIEEAYVKVANCVTVELERVPSAQSFNRKWLNENGLEAIAIAVGFEALGITPQELDKAGGGEAKAAAQGCRNARNRRRWGPVIMETLKTFTSMEDSPWRHAANRYLVFRFLCHGRWDLYEPYMVSNKRDPGSSDMQKKFNELNQVLAFPPANSGPVPRGLHPLVPT